MTNKPKTIMSKTSGVGNLVSWVFGMGVLGAGLINMFWGNDHEFGVFLVLLSFVYLLPFNDILKKMSGFSIPKMEIVKILLAIFIVFAIFGVGELYYKIELMKRDL